MQVRLYWYWCCTRKWEQVTGVLTFFLSEVGWFLKWGECGWEGIGGAWVACHPLRESTQAPAFASSTSEVAVGFWTLNFVHNLLQPHMCAIIFGPLPFLHILLLQEAFVQVQALQERVPGPSLSQVHITIEDSWSSCSSRLHCLTYRGLVLE